MKKAKYMIILLAVSILLLQTVCNGISSSMASMPSMPSEKNQEESNPANLAEEISKLQSENANLKAAISDLKSDASNLESELEQAKSITLDTFTRYDLETIIAELSQKDHQVELFTAEIKNARLEVIDGKRYFILDVSRHRPGWGWEISMDEAKEGYPVREEIRAIYRLVLNYKRYISPDDLLNQIKGYHETMSFLMIDHDVVFIAEQTGP